MANNVQNSFTPDSPSEWDKFQQNQKDSLKKKRHIWVIGISFVLIIAVICLVITTCNPKLPDQLKWSAWMDELPEYATPDDYLIDSQVVYRQRSLETTSSTSATMEGWSQTGSSYEWGNYGAWSGWSTSVIEESESKEVETKTQYSYRAVSKEKAYSQWSGWSNWSYQQAEPSDLCEVETGLVYEYCRWICPNCQKYPRDNDVCPSCGSRDNWVASWVLSETPYSSVSFYQKGDYLYGMVDGELLSIHKGDINKERVTGTRFRTRTTYEETKYSGWSEYTDTAFNASSTKEVQTRTVYRSRDRERVQTYYFERWGQWCEYGVLPIQENDSMQVETKTQYRFKKEMLHMGIGSVFLIILFFTLLIAEIVEFFAKSEELDGVMLFARPIIVLLLVLLDGKSFWLGLFYGLLWGFFGFVLHMFVDEHFSRKKDEDNRSIEQMLKDLQEATGEAKPQESTNEPKRTAHVNERKETQTKQPFEDIPSVSITEVAATTVPKTTRAAPNDAPPSKNTSTTPLDVPPPEVETYDF